MRTGTPTYAGGMPRKLVLATIAAWLLSLGVDMLLHAGLLASCYRTPTPFLLDADAAFRRIPLGYAAFLVLTFGLAWLVHRLDVRGAWRGLRLGLATGGLVWGALALGLYSITTAPAALLVGWWLGQGIELGLAGAVLASAAAGTPLRRLFLRVGVAVVVCILLTVALQTLGLAPPMRLAK